MSNLDTEITLISSSLLPSETLEEVVEDFGTRRLDITNEDSRRSLQIHVTDSYPARDAVKVELSGENFGRDEAIRWRTTVEDMLNNWDKEDEYPLYQILTTLLLPLIAPETSPPPRVAVVETSSEAVPLPILHHALLTSHHLLSPTKRKNFMSLASQLSLTGFSKVGHPGIYYAIGEKDDLDEWLREVKSWNWLALRVRVGIEPVPDEEQLDSRGRENGARGGKGRGDWTELEKLSDALEWMRRRGREKMLLDIGIGGGTSA